MYKSDANDDATAKVSGHKEEHVVEAVAKFAGQDHGETNTKSRCDEKDLSPINKSLSEHKGRAHKDSCDVQVEIVFASINTVTDISTLSIVP